MWMIIKIQSDRELSYWIMNFLHLMCSFSNMSLAIQEVAKDIDQIGWTDFLHGWVPVSFWQLQHSHCASINSRMMVKDWSKAFATQLLNITHRQWMFCNFSLHNKMQGHLELTQQANILTEIATLAESRPEDNLPKNRFLLEVEVVNLDSKSTAHQEYWIKAMKAALKAGQQCSSSRR